MADLANSIQIDPGAVRAPRMPGLPTPRVADLQVAETNPLGPIAKALDTASEQTNQIAQLYAKQAGYKAVQRDDQGNLIVAQAPIVGDAAIAFHAAVKYTGLALGESEAKQTDFKLSQTFQDNPQGYLDAAKASRDKHVAEYEKALGPDVGVELGKSIDTNTSHNYRMLVLKQQAHIRDNFDAGTTAKIKSIDDDITSLVGTGGDKTPDGKAQLDALMAQRVAITKLRVNNPVLGEAPEVAALSLKQLDEKILAAQSIYHVNQVYKDQGYKAATEAANDILTNPDYKLGIAQRQAIHSHSMTDIRANEAIRRQDIGEARAAFSELSMQSATGMRIEPDQVERVAEAFRSAGDPGGAARVYGTFSRKPLNDDFGKQPAADRAAGIMSVQGANAAAKATQFFIDKGYTKEQAAGIVGNLAHESGMNPLSVGDEGTSAGLAQFHNERLAALKQFAKERGTSPGDFQTQLEFVDHELKTSEGDTFRKLQSAKTPEDAAAAFVHYERPKGYTSENPAGSSGFASRVALARTVFEGKPSDGSGNNPAGMAWLAANRQRASDKASWDEWSTIMKDYTTDGSTPPQKRVADLTMAARATGNSELLEQIGHDMNRIQVAQDIADRPAAERHAIISQLQSEGTSGNLTPGHAALLKDLQHRDTAITKGLADNPIATTAVNFPDKVNVPPPLDMTSPDKFAAGLLARSRIAQFAAQNWKVATPAVLDAADLATVQAALDKPDPVAKSMIFSAISALPEDVRNATLAKIGDKRPDMMVSALAGGMQKESPDVSQSILRGQMALKTDPKYGPKDDENAAKQKLDQLLPAGTFSLVGRTDDSGPYAIATGAIKARYADLSAQSGDTSGKFNDARLKQSVDDVTGGVLSHNGGTFIAPARGMPQSQFDMVLYGVKDQDLAGVTTLGGQAVSTDYLRNNAQLESIGSGRYYVRLGGDPLKPVYAYQGANTEMPRKFVLDLRGKTVTPEGVAAYNSSLTASGVVSP